MTKAKVFLESLNENKEDIRVSYNGKVYYVRYEDNYITGIYDNEKKRKIKRNTNLYDYIMTELAELGRKDKTNESKVVKVKFRGDDYEVKIIDGTHLYLKPASSSSWGIADHFMQVPKEVIDQLRGMGIVQGNFFVEE